MEWQGDRRYTMDSAIKQALAIEIHAKDGSAVEAGCQCINTKHTYAMELFCEEGQGFALSDKEKRFYAGVGDLMRVVRKEIEFETFNLPHVHRVSKGACSSKIKACVATGLTREECRIRIKCE